MSTALILASQSPRRLALLTGLGLTCEQVPADLDERPRVGEAAEALVQRLAREKGRVVRDRFADDPRPVLAADTIVVVDDQVLGKPIDRKDALAMLASLSGRTHEVLTAVAVLPRRGAEHEVLDRSRVTFRPLRPGEAEAYWATGEPRDKAGAYAIQGLAEAFVTRLEGTFSGVMGLPLAATAPLLEAVGLTLWSTPS